MVQNCETVPTPFFTVKLVDQCQALPSSEKLPPAADGSQYRDPQPEYNSLIPMCADNMLLDVEPVIECSRPS
ncbi:hypothetical protein STEG23_020093 [Scotinomys teguina]